MTTTVGRPDTQDMIVVHRVFRRESRLMPQIVRACRPGDTARARHIAGFIRDYKLGLHEHHTGEDDLVWPLLLARVDLDADLVLRMEQQHEVMAAGLAAVDRHLGAWEATASAAARDALADALDQHRRDLLVHLDEEEQHVLALIEEHLTVAEWNALGERFARDTPKNKLLFFLGALLEEATPDERRALLANLPAAARVIWRLVGARKYARTMRKVRL